MTPTKYTANKFKKHAFCLFETKIWFSFDSVKQEQ